MNCMHGCVKIKRNCSTGFLLLILLFLSEAEEYHVFFECHYNSCHRVVGKNQGINYCRCKHQKKYPVLVELFAKPFPTILFHLLIPFLVCATFLLLNSLFFFVPLSYHFGILFTIRSFYKIFLVEIYCFTIFCAKCATLAFYLVAH